MASRRTAEDQQLSMRHPPKPGVRPRAGARPVTRGGEGSEHRDCVSAAADLIMDVHAEALDRLGR